MALIKSLFPNNFFAANQRQTHTFGSIRTKKKYSTYKFVLFVWFVANNFGINAIYAQNSIPLTVEIQNIEKIISRQDITGNERRDALVRLAQLRQLSGDIEGAAKNWLEAAGAVPNTVDDGALLACAYCLAAMGEWERASTALAPLLHKSPRARFLEVSMSAWRSGDVSALSAIANNLEYSQMKSEIYLMLWKSANGESAETWRRRLLAEFPQSPEGRLAAGENTASVAAKPSPFWLFLSGWGAFSQLEAQAFPPAAVSVPREAVSSPAAETQSRASSPAVSVRLQTGLFSRQANAQAQIADLRKAGFSPSMEQRIVNGNELWAVTVPAGQDVNRSIRELTAAGFNSFPLN